MTVVDTATSTTAPGRWSGATGRLATTAHGPALLAYAAVVLAHWAEHIAQAVQIYALGWPVADARGVLGLPFPWLVSSEWMHYGYAVVMLAGLVVLRHGFTGSARRWWTVALVVQVWHHFEHLLLLLQALVGTNLLDAAKPTSVAQLLIPRVELHLFYNTLVTVPMVVAMVVHLRSRADGRTAPRAVPAS